MQHEHNLIHQRHLLPGSVTEKACVQEWESPLNSRIMLCLKGAVLL